MRPPSARGRIGHEASMHAARQPAQIFKLGHEEKQLGGDTYYIYPMLSRPASERSSYPTGQE